MADSIFDKEQAIQERIQAAFETSNISKDKAYDISFHMTDWFSDISRMQELFSKEDLSNDEIRGFLITFLAHVPNHLNAASKLIGLGPIGDVFELGIFEED